MFGDSETSSVMVREVSYNGSVQSDFKPVRAVDNTRLSALTNQIMELVLDNIKMLHMNQKIIDYCKRQAIQAEFRASHLEMKI